MWNESLPSEQVISCVAHCMLEPGVPQVSGSWVCCVSGGGAHVGPEIALLCKLTAAVCVKARPFRVAPPFMVMAVDARIFPMKEVFVSIVADETTLHQTLQGSSPVTYESGDVISVADDLKIQTPDPVRARCPVRVKASAQ